MDEETVLVDGDWGGDEMQVLGVLLGAKAPRVRLAGATAVFGNTSVEVATKNANRLLHFWGADSVPYARGASAPRGEREPAEGDDAHGSGGLGGVDLPLGQREPEREPAHEMIIRILRAEPARTVTLVATGPLTNVAEVLAREPKVLGRLKRLVVMGGCTENLGAADMPSRRGNITPDAEFNFFMAPSDAGVVMDSGVPVVLFPMNCTQCLSFSEGRRDRLRARFGDTERLNLIARMISAPAALDRYKFGSPPFMHDVHTALYLLYPDMYAIRKGRVHVARAGENRGRTTFVPAANGTVAVAEDILDIDQLFDLFCDCLVRREHAIAAN